MKKQSQYRTVIRSYHKQLTSILLNMSSEPNTYENVIHILLLVILGIELRVLYFLSGILPLQPHLYPFSLQLFFIGSLTVFAGLAWSVTLFTLPMQLGKQLCTTTPSFMLRWLLTKFLPRLTLNCYPPTLYLLSSQGYRQEQSHPAYSYF